ncbi:MAG: glycoside hydrolase family 97 protein [Planctomycetaceae bacterium]|nr:glycoside hydrolase family 97 protein [Planctomycetaceae bacterium]
MRHAATADAIQRVLSIWVAALGLLASASQCLGADRDVRQPVTVKSPDGYVEAELSLAPSGTGESVPHLRVRFHGKEILLPSPLRVDLAEGLTLGSDCVVEAVQSTQLRNDYVQQPGKRKNVIERGSEVVISLRDQFKVPRRWQLVLRAYDDGVAYRYRFPKQEGWPSLVVAGERSEFVLPAEARAFALPLNGFTTSYEKRYEVKQVGDLPRDWLLGLPLLLELPGTGWAAITEANLTDYAGMYLSRAGEQPMGLVSRLSPLPKEPKVAVRAELPHDSPWRVILLGEQVGRLVESDLLLHLNAPCAIEDTVWIKSGKTTFPWWNGYYEENVPFRPGLNTATVRYYIDFCAESGIACHSLDGKDNTAWYGGPIVPFEGASPTKGVDGLDLPEVLRYARTRGVKLRFWMHWQAARAHMSRAFPLYREWGVEGVMIDFMDRDDQEMVNFLRELLQTAAENHLTVTLHGSPKPTGLERTYHNLLSSEGVMNLEYDKWDKLGVSPEHEVTIPFTRMLAGPLDFHQGSFRTVTPEEFKPRNEAPLVIGTPCRTLASYVVYQNHLSMVADYPSAYRGHPALPVLAKIPTTWDDTKVLTATVGEAVVIARRSGDDWWIGAMTNREARDFPVSLDILGAGTYRAEVYRDDLSAPHRLSSRTVDVRKGGLIEARLAPAGGLLIHLAPAPASR